jgi:hypothetical protein
MRAVLGLSLALTMSCGTKPAVVTPAPQATPAEAPPAPAPAAMPSPTPTEPTAETMGADTPKATVAGNTFIAPAGWSMSVRGSATILTPPESSSHIALVDVKAQSASDAVALAWAAYDPRKKYEVKLSTPSADHDGWSKITGFDYVVSPNEKRVIFANALFANDTWTVIVFDVEQGVAEKRGSQINTMLGRFLPKGFERESFAGKEARPLDKTRIAELQKFIETSEKLLGVPGVSFGIVEKGKVVFIGGVGVRELGKPAKVDGDTKFIIASNTKALTTLMLAKIVDD